MKKSLKILLSVLIPVAAVGIAVAVILAVGGSNSKVKVELEINGGNVAAATAEVDKNGEFVLPEPEKSGYAFDGWFDNAELSGAAIPAGTKVTVTNNKTYYAAWTKLYTVAFDTDGGNAISSISLREGAKVAAAVSSVEAQKDGYKFGAWRLNGADLAPSYAINSDITLKAEYMIPYTLAVYEQNRSLDGYELSSADSETYYAYAGAIVRAEKDMDGFTAIDHADNVLSLTVTDGGANRLVMYFDRKTFDLGYYADYPDGTTDVIRETVIYGDSVTVYSTCFSFEGYYLAGWATSSGGEVVYSTNSINNLLYNKDETDVTEAASFTPSKNTSLFAVWKRGYSNMFGGDDYIYLISEDDKNIYLSRGNVFFKGKYNKRDRSFVFFAEIDGSTEEILYGNLLNDGTYVYGNGDRAESSAVMYDAATAALNENVKIYFDEYNGITYSVFEGGGSDKTSDGTYVIEDGVYIAKFTEGELSGKTLRFIRGSVMNEDGVATPAFRVRNEEECALGTLARYFVSGNGVIRYEASYGLTLNGFGKATFDNGSSTVTYDYSYDADEGIIALTTTSGMSVFSAKLFDDGGLNGYFYYNEALDKKFVSGDASLTLDGASVAIYDDGAGNAYTGYYTVSTSVFDGYIVNMTLGDKTFKFLTETVTETTSAGEVAEGEETVTHYLFSLKTSDYAEYYYKDENGVYYYPLLVFGDDADGKVLVYGRTNTSPSEYLLAAKGTAVYDEQTKRYTFTVTDRFNVTINTYVVDLNEVDGFTFALDTYNMNGSQLPVNYWYSYAVGSETFDNTSVYTSADGSTLVLVAGMASLKGSEELSGTYTISDGIVCVTAENGVYAFETDGDTFVKLSEPPFTAYLRKADGTIDGGVTLRFDGKGGAELKTGDDTITGTYSLKEQATPFDTPVYTFTADGMKFDLIRLTLSGTACFTECGETCGTFSSSEGRLTLDGYSFDAEWTDVSGTTYRGTYTVNEDDAVVLIADGSRYCFDISGASFKKRGDEYSERVLVDNGGIKAMVKFDGYGNAEVSRVTEGGDKETIDDNADYQIDGDGITLRYTDGNAEMTVTLRLSTIAYSGADYLAAYVVRSSAKRTYVDPTDWSTLVLDDVGGAVGYGSDGQKTYGKYMLITGSMLYFVASDGTNARVYDYDNESGSATPKDLTARGFYTHDLQTLLFSQYGLAVFSKNGEAVTYYYNMEGDDVILYHRDANDPTANEYGFVAENFGVLTEKEKPYDGQVYISNSVLRITFARTGNTQNYVFKTKRGNTLVDTVISSVTFIPDGNQEFSVQGQMVLTNVQGADRTFTTVADCTVVRRLKNGGGYEVYALINAGNSSYYRFDLDLDYQGVNDDGESLSKYELVGMSRVRSFTSYTYMDNLYRVYTFRGASSATAYENENGVVELIYDFTEDGEESEAHLETNFGKGISLVDTNGDAVAFDGKPVTATSENFLHAEATGKDGYLYRLHFMLVYQANFRAYGFAVYAFTRVQELSCDNYTLETETVVFSEHTMISKGNIYSFALKKGEENVKADAAFRIAGSWYYVSRHAAANGKYDTAVYYKLDLTTAGGGDVGEEDTVPVYSGLTVTELAVQTVYASNGADYADIGADGRVYYLYKDGSSYYVTECEYDDETSSYTVTLSSGDGYVLTVSGGVLTIKKA
ncbi:MAG: InlB B-repeat-containing protein [Clostridia bacterium]|nr:InlB B-repeat-containing protein [Clostridia bacterium]